MSLSQSPRTPLHHFYRHDHGHECEHEHWLEFQLFQLRAEADELEAEVAAYLASPWGQFELYYAERERARWQG